MIEKTINQLSDKIKTAIEDNKLNRRKINKIYLRTHSKIFAEAIERLGFDNIVKVMSLLRVDKHADIFLYLSSGMQEELIRTLDAKYLNVLMKHIAPDDAVDLLQSLPAEYQTKILDRLSKSEKDELRKLAKYKDGEVGAVMTTEFITLPPKLTVNKSLDILRKIAKKHETIYTCYIVDNEKLIGVLSLREIFLSDPSKRLKDIMTTNVISISNNDDQENAARLIQEYDLYALPVINNDNKLLGIVTHDDCIDIINQEQTEDIEKLMAIGGDHKYASYLESSTFSHVKSRGPWVIVLAIFGIITGTIMGAYEDILSVVFILMIYMPMIADTGGTVGSQSGTLVIRALVTKEVTSKDIFKILYKELKISLVIGLLMSALAFFKVYILSHGITLGFGNTIFMIAVVVSISFFLQIVSSTLIGAVLPVIADKFKIDPAVVSSPVLTTIVDITGLLIFFNLATFALNIN